MAIASSSHPAPRRISVVIPARDAAGTIAEQLAALAGQEYVGDWEVIVADNGSTDQTRGIVEDWRARVPGLRVVDASARPGPSFARNRGAADATGDLLVFCDADDAVAPGWLAAVARAAVDFDVVTGPQDVGPLNATSVQAWRSPRDSATPCGVPAVRAVVQSRGLGVCVQNGRRIRRDLPGVGRHRFFVAGATRGFHDRVRAGCRRSLPVSHGGAPGGDAGVPEWRLVGPALPRLPRPGYARAPLSPRCGGGSGLWSGCRTSYLPIDVVCGSVARVKQSVDSTAASATGWWRCDRGRSQSEAVAQCGPILP